MDNELDRERARVARLYDRLDGLRDEEARRLNAVRSSKVGGNHQMRSERDALARMHEDRLLQLRDVDARLVFGRLQLPKAAEDEADSAFRYIGRLGLRDEEQRSLLLDWRAPQAAAFYQATAANPQGVLARRHVTMRDREVTHLDDEVFDADLLAQPGAALEVQGEGALMAALTGHRTGRMHDIVATIQAEQDRIIRSEMRGALVVQGGPGTGKTAVALHRAAYLLYTHRDRLGSAGVLIVGPSGAFLRYIETVLPSLGETGVVLQSLGELFPGVRATDDDSAAAAVLKGSLEMVDLIARAVKSRQRVPADTAHIDVNGDVLRVSPALIARAIQRAQQSGKAHNEARVVFVNQALDALAAQLANQLRTAGAVIDDTDASQLREDIRESTDAKIVLNTAWLPMTAEKLIGDLFARPDWLAELTPRWTPEKRALLHRARTEPFTISDIPLLDEAAELLGSPPAAPEAGQRERDLQRANDIENAKYAIRNAGVEGMVSAEQLADNFAEAPVRVTTADRAATDRTWTYGHVVVDEAQELSPMHWRLLVRRSPMRSFTIVGDIAQASSAASSRSWRSALDPFFRGRWDLEELTVNYRTPAQIAREAERVAGEHGLPITPAQSVREGDWPIRDVTVGSPDALPLAVAEAVRVDRGIDASGTLAVIVSRAARAAVLARLIATFGTDVGAGEAGLECPIAVLTTHESKGLEFDAVVLADPAALVAESPRGAAALYVAMTRPTQRLTQVHVDVPSA
ncbi:HelD family protein [Glaciibacter psychrotolerans]|uniref:DNA helicase IV n=1 Tax=Glaciibacter psychrotolerans TaxID=670054 RepID=A0A7Z0EH73_9MICO|nr:AAA family ATPase [Leifsonia psychrotolerans]NYJ21495.1 DNA helicase IV [Leifsonia psychrotolerans]